MTEIERYSLRQELSRGDLLPQIGHIGDQLRRTPLPARHSCPVCLKIDSSLPRLLVNRLQELQDFPLAWGGGIGGHVHGIPGGIKGNLLQVVPRNAQRLQADGHIQLPIERKQTLLQIVEMITKASPCGR
jgi:hypothetical protein